MRKEHFTNHALRITNHVKDFMKQKIIIALITLTLCACNMTLARDVTPPANYVAPTAVPTIGAVYPSNKPNIENGKIIFQEKCAPCHGDSGLGDGEQGKQLPVTVKPIGLPEVANQASPAKWYSIVTQGNIDNFMPPFASLSEQEKWDVITYAFTLHTTPEQIEMGKNLFESNCANCDSQFTNLENMSAISDVELMKQIKDSFGKNFSDEELSATASYIRTLTFASESAPIVDSTPSAESTLEVSDQAEASAEAGNITGQIENRSNESFPTDLQITLRGFQHSSDPNAGADEFVNETKPLNTDGTYSFTHELSEGQIYLIQFTLDGLNYQSQVAVVPADTNELNIPTLVVYETTDNFSTLQIDSVEIFFDLTSQTEVQLFSVYTFTNRTDKTILINLENETVPFISFPSGASGLGYEAAQDSAIFIPSENGFAIPPSETPYGLIAFASIPRTKRIQFSMPAVLDISQATVLLPEGVTAKGDVLVDEGVQAFQDTNFQIYSAGKTPKGGYLEFTISGTPKGTTENTNLLENQNVLLGIGTLGVVLICVGIWMYLKDRSKVEIDYEDDGNDSTLDAIIALDDLHKDKKISDEAYHARRNELKNKLKRES